MADDEHDATRPVSTAWTTPPAAPGASPDYGGTAVGIGRIALRNIFFNLLTLGFYRFWGKTRLRRYLWGSISFHGDALEYTGLAKELFFGFLIALAVLVPLGIGFGILDFYTAGWGIEAQSAVQSVYSVVLLILFQFAYFRARRYRLTRTTWRGIRGGQTGSSVKYAFLWLGHMILLGATAGLTVPLKNTTLQRFRMNNTWLGDRKFEFDGRAKDLFGRWLLAWLFFIPTLGLTYVWYKAAELRYFARRTSFENLRLELPVTGGQIFGIYAWFVLAVSAAIVVAGGIVGGFLGITAEAFQATLKSGEFMSLAGPTLIAMFLVLYMAIGVIGTVMLTHRLANLLCTRLVFTGEQDFEAIVQSSRAVPARGEGLADALDVGGF
jgi:uncharacterized membrane protein YjgN (DUF898 family)